MPSRTFSITDHPPRVALVGISGYGKFHLRYLETAAAKGLITFTAVVVINQEEEVEACKHLAEQGVSIYESWQAMLADHRGRIDLCLIPVPIHLHEEMTVAALEAGSNVLVEKPLAASVAQVKSIQDAEKRTGKWVAVAFQDFYCPTTRAIRSQLDQGKIGRIQSIRWSGFWPRPEAYYARNDWAGRIAIGSKPLLDSPLNNAMAHFLHLSLYWAGSQSGQVAWPESVQSELFRCFPIESFDTAVVRAQTETGVTLHMAATHCCPAAHPIHIRIQGESGELDWTHRSHAVWSRHQKAPEKIAVETHEEAMEAMFAAVLSRFYSTEAVICTTDMALPQVAFIESLHENGKIRDIDPQYIEHGQLNGSPNRIIRNIESDLEQCLTRKALPSELSLAWAGSVRGTALLPA